MLSSYMFLEYASVTSEIRFFLPNARHYEEKCASYMVVFVKQLNETEVLHSSR